MSKKKILIIGPAFPYRGGNSLFISHTYDILKDEFDVTIFNYKLLYPAILFPGKTQYDESKVAIKKAPNVRAINSINPLNWLSVAAKINRNNFDLVVFDWWHPFFAPCHFAISFLIKKKYSGKILFITENFISHEGHFIDRTLTNLGLKNASSFLALSDKVATDIQHILRGRKIYKSELPVYDCYDSDSQIEFTKSSLGFDETCKLILFFGYVRKYKGLDILIDAMKILVEKDASFRLLIVGEFYDSPSEYEQQIVKLNLDAFVQIKNEFVPNEEVSKYYQPADVVVLPYRSATQSGILNVAYGFGKPVIVTNVGGLSEFVDDGRTGLIVEPNSAKSIAEGIMKFFDLKNQIDFTSNIKKSISNNAFAKLPQLFNLIIDETQK